MTLLRKPSYPRGKLVGGCQAPGAEGEQGFRAGRNLRGGEKVFSVPIVVAVP